MKNPKLQPLIYSLVLVVGVLLGTWLSRPLPGFESQSKLREVLSAIQLNYVDDIQKDSLVDQTIQQLVGQLDPHTAYLPPADAAMSQSQLHEAFDGIGVEFNIVKDTVYVITPLIGGPSEAVGIQTGDAIMVANKIAVSKKGVDNAHVFSTLRGERGSKVILKIYRKSAKKLLTFVLKRDQIRSFSVDAAYMLNPITGYIRITRFAENTHQEFFDQLNTLKKAGLKNLVIDMRGNPGGYLEQATAILDELIAGQGKLVYTKSHHTKFNNTIYAGKEGALENGKLAVLIDESSASAAEIVAGVLQDYDRAQVVGRRSFGKGLVQQSFDLSDGSELRLTIARYYIPSGRCVQRDFVRGQSENYLNDELSRAGSGEWYHADSMKVNPKLKYKTLKGKTVYGGGGIYPDVFVKKDTAAFTPWLAEVFGLSVMSEFTLSFVQKEKGKLKNIKQADFIKNYRVADQQIDDLVALATQRKINKNEGQIERSKVFIKRYLKAQLARQIYRTKDLDNAANQVLNESDPMIISALKILK